METSEKIILVILALAGAFGLCYCLTWDLGLSIMGAIIVEGLPVALIIKEG